MAVIAIETCLEPGLGRQPELWIGGLPQGREDAFALVEPDDLPYATFYDVIHEKLAGEDLRRFSPGSLMVELTQRPDSYDPNVTINSVLRIHPEGLAVSGLADCFFRTEGVTYYQRHTFRRQGMTDTTSPPRPLDRAAKKELDLVLGQLHGPGVILGETNRRQKIAA